MTAQSKRLLPIELLRRSARKLCQKVDTPDCDKVESRSKPPTIKKERRSAAVKDYGPADDTLASKRVKIEPKKEESQAEASALGKKVSSIEPDGCLLVGEEELDLERTLLGGQSFRWVKQEHSDSKQLQTLFTGTIASNVFQLWRCDSERVAYKKLNIEAPLGNDATEMLLKDYFQLQYKLSDLYDYWSKRDDNFKECSQHYKGYRILRQDPVENVFSFICATNNNIKRISLMICGLCRRFGLGLCPKKTTILNQYIEDRFFTFPTVERLAQDDVFNVLRYELGFGYRAKFICETAKRLVSVSSSQSFDGPRNYLMSLRQASYKETCKRLQEFPGIGRKVADCICLMSMDHLGSVPIDCHIYEIVCRNYIKTLRQERKTLTEKVHDMIGDYFVGLHGPLAGWATSVLFVGELKHLKRDLNSGTSDQADKKTIKRKNNSKKKE